MLRRELHKVFIRRKLLVLVIVVLAAEALIAFIGAGAELSNEEDRALYLSLCGEFSGKLTDEKREMLKHEKELFEEAGYACEGLEKYEKYLSGRNGGALFFSDADYAVKTGTPIVNACAWRALFGKPKQELLLASLMLVFVLVSETAENETNVTGLKRSSVFGGKRLYRLDAMIGLGLALTASASVSFIRFAAVALSYGLHGGNDSVAALSLFENSPLAAISLQGAFLFASALSALGLCAFTSLLFIIGRLSRSSVTTALCGVLIVILPPYVLKAPELYYASPVSLMQSVGFLIGDVVDEGAQFGGRIVWSTAAGRGSLAFSIFIALILVFSALTIYGRKEKKK